MNILLIVMGLIILIFVTYGYKRAKHPFWTATKNAITGLSGLLLINLTSGATGCYIAVNQVTVFVATVLSLPGVFSLLIMKLIFNY